MIDLSLTICVPVYNWDVQPLVEALLLQVEKSAIPCHILIVDDASTVDLPSITSSDFVEVVRLDVNLGRSGVRNFMVKHSQTSHVLFIDGDCLVGEDFVKTYVDKLLTNDDAVICGGLVYPEKWEDDHSRLRYMYGVTHEVVELEARRGKPYASFKTSNFLAPRMLMLNISFDERLAQYGHEDTLFGLQLRQNGESIVHIDAPVVHLGLESNEVFLEKTEMALDNLFTLFTRYPQLFSSDKINILSKGLFRNPISVLWARMNARRLKNRALTKADVKAFQLYKLTYALMNR